VISIVIISKDEPALDTTLVLVEAQARALPEMTEVVVVDASEGRLDEVRGRHPGVRWLDYRRPSGVAVTIPHQRNLGVRSARGEVIVFTDAGCMPESGWLERLSARLMDGSEAVVCGRTLGSPDGRCLYDKYNEATSGALYLSECPTINLGFRREAFESVGEFDETFAYGSDIDFSWRLVSAGYRVRQEADALVRHDWGPPVRQVRRSFAYGRARARLYRKHPRRLLTGWRSDPMVWVYPAFLLGLPIAVAFPPYLALLGIVAWRNRSYGPVLTVIDHLTFGAGVLAEILG
jgi:Glycosyl transferase family 2